MNRREEHQKRVWAAASKAFSFYETKCSPASWSLFRYREGWYLIARFAILVICFLGASNRANLINSVFCAVGLVFLLDIIVANTSIAFVTKSPINNLRSFLLTFFTFSHVILIYGMFYRFLAHEFAQGLCATQALYFSTVTITTVGYGDFAPEKWASAAQSVVVLEVLTGLFFVTGVFARVIGFQERSITPKGKV
jgi:hypothetical protein